MEEIPSELGGLRHFEDPATRRIAVKTAIRTGKLTVPQLVRMIFDNCYSEEDFAEEALKWIDAINEVVDPRWSTEELKDYGMKQRGLKR